MRSTDETRPEITESHRSTNPSQRLRELGIELPPLTPPIASYAPFVLVGDLLFLAAHLSKNSIGKCGRELTKEQGRAAAVEAAISALGTARAALNGDLDRVVRVVRMLGMVNCTDDFLDTPFVIDGASDLLVEVFGAERGLHARAAVGMAQLPRGATIEIELLLQVRL